MSSVYEKILDKIKDKRIKGHEPILILLHPNDYEKTVKETETRFGHVWGLTELFGLPVIVTSQIEENKALIVPKETLEILIDIYRKYYEKKIEEMKF